MSSEIPQVVVSLLSSHLQLSTGGKTLLVGPQVQAIADFLAAGFCDHHFEIAWDLQDLLTEGIASSLPDESELICFVDAFSEVGKLQQEQVLSMARNGSSCRVLHLEQQQAGDVRWKLTDSLSLGYRRVDSIQTEQTQWRLYEYQISSYKITPAWLNADQWANPQNWDRFRW